MLTAENLWKRYGKATALKGATFSIPDNAIAGIIGPNGAGKSTLLKIITGFENADNGEILLEGKRIQGFYEKMHRFAYMPERLDIYPEYRTGEFIRFVRTLTGVPGGELLRKLNLDSVLDKKIKSLSKGYKQRLKLFFALANRKPLVVLDEPFDGFDPIQLMEIIEVIRAENASGRVFLVSIHQLHDAEKLCNYYILLNDGRIIAQGSLPELHRAFGMSGGNLEQIFIRALR